MPGCAILVFPGNPPQSPKSIQKLFLIIFAWFCKMLQKDRKIKRPKSAQSLTASYVKKVVLRRYASFFRNRRAWVCQLSVRDSPTQVALKKYLTSVVRFYWLEMESAKKIGPPTRGPWNSASYDSYVKKVVCRSFHLFRSGCAWMCHLSALCQHPKTGVSNCCNNYIYYIKNQGLQKGV